MATLTRGKFITFEGGEGAGKTTQVERLVNHLILKGVPVWRTREPGGSPGAEDIRRLLVEGEPGRWLPMSELLLFAAARYDHVERIIKPKLAEGTWVISDRFIDSSYVYQGVARGLGSFTVGAIHNLAFTDMVMPDLTFVLDINPTIGLDRAARRRNAETRFHEFHFSFHQTLRAGYKACASEPRHKIVDASVDLDEMTCIILKEIYDRFAR